MSDFKSLKARIDLLAFLQARGLTFKRRGSRHFAVCPFHKEKTASFAVDPKKQRWTCFGCGESGDVFAFVQRQDGVSFREAVRLVCELDLPPAVADAVERERDDWTEDSGEAPSKEILDRVLEVWKQALAHTPRAQAYLKGRGLFSPEILQALQVGFSSGKLPQMLARDGKVRKQLIRAGLLNEKGNEFFYCRIVVPLFDENGLLVNVYGRAVDAKSTAPHFYLRGSRRGVFNRVGIRGASVVILTESILDAMSFLVLGLANTTASFGANGFTAELRMALVAGKVQRVLCAYDPDEAGDRGAKIVARELAEHGIEVLRVALPAKDPNEFVKGGGTREELEELLAKAEPLTLPVPATPAPAPSTLQAPSVAVATVPEKNEPAETTTPLEFVRGDRVYHLEKLPTREKGALKVMLRASREGRTFVDTFNLYVDKSRTTFIGRVSAAFRGQVPRKVLEDDLYALLDEIEALAKVEKDDSPPAVTMSAQEREEAIGFLEGPDLIAAIVEDISRLGVVGEADNKLLVYLVATSRLLGKPLSLSVIARASAGKSLIINCVLDMLPPEQACRFTRMSPLALFYDDPGRYKHKVLFVEEAIGAKEADLGIRSMQSERRLSNLTTRADPKDGKLKTQETVVEGPLTYITTSVEPLDYETATRSFEMAIDESPEQTERIIENLRAEQTLAGHRQRAVREAVLCRHRNAQRLLEQVDVVNEHAPKCRFPGHTLRLRREAGKYFALMQVVALLHQRQREIRVDEVTGRRYVTVEPEDVDVANRLIVPFLSRALCDLCGPTLELILRIQEFVAAKAKDQGCDLLDVRFSRLELREATKWDDHQLRANLEKLVEQEYVEVVSGAMGKRYVYTLPERHRILVTAGMTLDERITAFGLTRGAELKRLGK